MTADELKEVEAGDHALVTFHALFQRLAKVADQELAVVRIPATTSTGYLDLFVTLDQVMSAKPRPIAEGDTVRGLSELLPGPGVVKSLSADRLSAAVEWAGGALCLHPTNWLVRVKAEPAA